MAIGAMKIINEKGYNIPKDFSVIGFDNITVSKRVFPPLTTIAAPIDDIAEKSINLIIDII